MSYLCCWCVGECLVVGQSHFKSFDNKFFTFAGHCQYLLAKDCSQNEFSIIIENVQVKVSFGFQCKINFEFVLTLTTQLHKE